MTGTDRSGYGRKRSALEEKGVKVELTVRAIEALQERARVTREVSRRLREKRLVVQCAWCERVGDGEGQWAHTRRLLLRPGQVTATICPYCGPEFSGADARQAVLRNT